ncbi:hypothetical protein D9757_008042 [Collybiopsis confluens]|uniref:Uncharacterized protein n=1 Tax=Collybiopsis confluens TaxID=2823264 RepID=A0A8H5H645_9AGAR|nr:hypothetical protein D9757_008042 [Collybiopsis confluens]
MQYGEIPLIPSNPVGSSEQFSDLAHDPSYGWPRNPGSFEYSDSPKSWLRLLVLKSRALSCGRIVVIDGYSQVQLGRDNPVSSKIPRIRLKEMEVSKHHAIIYWDYSWDAWAVVDLGSKHGTFLQSNNSNSSSVERKTRLSSSRTSSKPRRLSHLDQLSLGTTTFLVHVHENCLPCGECSPGMGEDIPLFATAKIRLPTGQDLCSSKPQNSKTALLQLKRNLIARHFHDSDMMPESTHYIDRSARRRALHPASSLDAPGVPIPLSDLFEATVPSTAPSTEAILQSEQPIPITSVGHKLLIKQGWRPGTSLGVNDSGMINPLAPRFHLDRSGLGLKSVKWGMR